jgi:hypothetical protein
VGQALAQWDQQESNLRHYVPNVVGYHYPMIPRKSQYWCGVGFHSHSRVYRSATRSPLDCDILTFGTRPLRPWIAVPASIVNADRLAPHGLRDTVTQPPLGWSPSSIPTGSRFFPVHLPGYLHPPPYPGCPRPSRTSLLSGVTSIRFRLSPSLMFVNCDHLRGAMSYQGALSTTARAIATYWVVRLAPPRVSQPWWSKVDRARFELAAAARVFALLK